MNRQYQKPKKEVPFEVLLRRFKRDVERSGLMKELKKRESFESRGARRRRKREEGKRRYQREQMKEAGQIYFKGNVPKHLRGKVIASR